MSDAISSVTQTGANWRTIERKLPEFRWAVPLETTTKSPMLQEAVQDLDTGKITWVVVPTVIYHVLPS
jgi:hypothetical protein